MNWVSFPYLEYVSWEKREEDDDKREHKTDILNPLNVKKASFINASQILWLPHNSHKNDEQNDALEAEVFAKCIDEEVSHEEGILHE